MSREKRIQKWLAIEKYEIFPLIIDLFILKYVQTDPPTKESLSQLIIQLLQYQETKLGKNAQDAMTTRLPVRKKML